MRPDPIGGKAIVPQSLNRYSYSVNDPVNLTDPLGLDPFDWIMDASVHGPGMYIDGIQLLPGEEGIFWGIISMGAGVIAPFGSRWNARGGPAGTGGWEGYSATATGQGWTPLVGAPPGYFYNWYTYQKGDLLIVGVTLTELKNVPQIGAAPHDSSSWASMFFDWVFNRGEPNRFFGPDATLTKNLRGSPGVDRARQAYCQRVASGGRPYYSTLVSWGLGFPGTDDGVGRTTSMTRQFVGSFTLTIEGGAGSTMFTAYNETSLKSFLYHAPGVQNVRRGEGPGGNMRQTFFWWEDNPCGNR